MESNASEKMDTTSASRTSSVHSSNNAAEGGAPTSPSHCVAPVSHRTTTNMWSIHVCPTTGGQFTLQVSKNETVEGLKKVISRRLKIPRERISLLNRERCLREGTLEGNGVGDNTRLTLLPNVESGLVSQRTDSTVMQALENLTEGQVTDFLTGRSPLTLAMRLGDHMMFVQLQLSTTPPRMKRSSSSSSSSHKCSKRQSSHPSTSSRSSNSSLDPASTLRTPGPIPGVPLTPVISTPRFSVKAQPHLYQNSAGTATTSSTIMESSKDTHIIPTTTTSPTTSSATTINSALPQASTSQAGIPVLNGPALAEAKRNLSQKLQQITQLGDAATQMAQQQQREAAAAAAAQAAAAAAAEAARKAAKPGAIIESMHHLGQGVYSGTFSGTLNPALQDRDGKPKRNIGTIIHILNDLLGASPQYRAHLHSRRPERTERVHHHRSRPKSIEECRRLQQENRVVRGKMEHIQMMLEERRQRRQARRQARASPYSQWAGCSPTVTDIPKCAHKGQRGLKVRLPSSSSSCSSTSCSPVPSPTSTTPQQPQQTMEVEEAEQGKDEVTAAFSELKPDTEQEMKQESCVA